MEQELELLIKDLWLKLESCVKYKDSKGLFVNTARLKEAKLEYFVLKNKLNK